MRTIFNRKKEIILLFSFLFFGFLISYIVLAWTEPTQSPPGGNVPAPINVGPVGQAKEGGLILNTGGAEYGLIVDKGKVGIGTAAPGQKLDVAGNINYTGQLTKLDVADRFTATVRAADFLLGYSGRRGSPGRALVDLGGSLALNYAGDWGKTEIHGGITYIAGNVGIGTTNPSQKLDVVGGYVRSDTGFCIGSDCITSWPSGGGVGGGGTKNYLAKWTGATTLGNSIIYETGGKVGIGTTNPKAKFHVDVKNIEPGVIIQSNKTAPTIRLLDSADNDFFSFRFFRAGNRLEFDSSGANDILVLTKEGRIGVGTGNPGAKLEIRATGEWSWPEWKNNPLELWDGQETLYMGADDNHNLSYIQAVGNGTFHNLVLQARGGKVGIGTSNPEVTLEVDGDFKVTGNSNTCHLVSYSSRSGITECPPGYYTWAGEALTEGTMLCCKVDNPL